MHYIGQDFNDSDQDKDMELPFKSHSTIAFTDIQSVPLQTETISLRPLIIGNKGLTAYTRLNFQSSHLSSIWQPPKFHS
jgi:hypothetical protein